MNTNQKQNNVHIYGDGNTIHVTKDAHKTTNIRVLVSVAVLAALGASVGVWLAVSGGLFGG